MLALDNDAIGIALQDEDPKMSQDLIVISLKCGCIENHTRENI